MLFSFVASIPAIIIAGKEKRGRRTVLLNDETLVSAIFKFFKFLKVLLADVSLTEFSDFKEVFDMYWSAFCANNGKATGILRELFSRRGVSQSYKLFLNLNLDEFADRGVIHIFGKKHESDPFVYIMDLIVESKHARNILLYMMRQTVESRRYIKKAEKLREDLRKMRISLDEFGRFVEDDVEEDEALPDRNRRRVSEDADLLDMGDFYEGDLNQEDSENEGELSDMEYIEKDLSQDVIRDYGNLPDVVHFLKCGYYANKIASFPELGPILLPTATVEQPREGCIIPFFIGFLYGFYKRLERENIRKFGHVNIVIRFEIHDAADLFSSTDEDVTLTLVGPPFYTRTGNLRNWNFVYKFWCGKVYNSEQRKLIRNYNAQYSSVLEKSSTADPDDVYILRNITDYWLNEFRVVLDKNMHHYGTRSLAEVSDKFFFAVKAVTLQFIEFSNPVQRGSGFVRGNRTIIAGEDKNLFWQGVLDTKDKWGDLMGHFIFIKGDVGCFMQAVQCDCYPFRKEPYFCKCVARDTIWKNITVSEIPDFCKGEPIMVIAITIPSQKDRVKRLRGDQPERGVVVVYHSRNFYKERMGKVIFINVPEWTRGSKRGHCVIWRNSIYEEEGFERFKEMSKFNCVVKKLCSCSCIICPICAEFIEKESLMKSHYMTHVSNYTCQMCGLSFDKEEDFSAHCTYHCKLPRYGAKIALCDELQQYKEKSEEDVLIIYSDLESSIGEDGEHLNILAGWVDTKNMKVHLHDSLEEMLEAWAKLKEKKLRIYFHNGEGYDFHFMIKCLCDYPSKFVKNFDLTCDSSEKVRYFSVDFKNKHLEFRDTFAFVSTSLEKWIKSTLGSGCTFPCFTKNIAPDKREELLRKNPFPYNAIKTREDLNFNFSKMFEWMEADNAEELFCFKFKKDELEEIKKRLKVLHAQFNWMTIGDYYRDYLICDISHLCDCMEFFGKNVREEYGLNVHQFYGIPGLTWAAWLKQNKFKLEPVLNPKMFDVINSSIRGGQTGAMTRWYDEQTEPGSFVCDLDCNSLYPTVMLKFPFPCHDWTVCCSEIFNTSKRWDCLGRRFKELHEEGKSGFLEIDMIVKDEKRFYSYVPVASKRTIKGEFNYQSMVEYCSLYGRNVDSLIFTGLTQVVGEHKHYCCHSRLLEWYLENDVIEITYLHYMFIGKDEPVFEEYVKHNLEMRRKYADDPIKKMLYKLLNNSLYGKTYEDVTNRTSFKLVLTETMTGKEDIHRIVEKFGDWTLYESVITSCEINKPVYLGACITEYSKLWMYKFFYNFIRPRFPNSEVLYTDTDALTLKFPAEYGIRSLRGIADALNTDEEQIIDTSNFSTPCTEARHLLHNNEPGLFKSETGEGRIIKMVALRAKTYIMVCDDGTIKMSVKGCPMEEKGKLTYEEFYRVLMGETPAMAIEFSAIRTERHRVFNRTLTKIVLSADDQKRFIADDKIHTYPLFSKPHLEAKGKIMLPLCIEFS